MISNPHQKSEPCSYSQPCQSSAFFFGLPRPLCSRGIPRISSLPLRSYAQAMTDRVVARLELADAIASSQRKAPAAL